MVIVLLLALASAIKCLFALMLLPLGSSAYAAYMSVTRTRAAAHLRHYHLQTLEASLQS